MDCPWRQCTRITSTPTAQLHAADAGDGNDIVVPDGAVDSVWPRSGRYPRVRDESAT